jgi:methionyl-tRNA formyltransferase
MRVVFMGTPDFAVPTLKKLLVSRHDVVLVVTGPDKPRGRGQKVLPTPVKKVATEHGVPVYQPDKLKDPSVPAELRRWNADVFVVVAFRILPEAVIEIPPKGVINLHASLLPKYRGAAPIQWAILNGETETGLTTFYIEKGVDTGDIILQERVPIGPEETAGELHDRLAERGADLVLQTLDLIETGKAPRKKQEGVPTRAPKITPDLCRIDWQKGRHFIQRQVRAFCPVPGAFTALEGKRLKIYHVRPAEIDMEGEPGQLLQQGERLFVATADGWLEILELQPEGKRRMAAAEFLRGRKIGENVRLGEGGGKGGTAA